MGFNPRTAYIDNMLFLALLPIFDIIPILVVLVYQVITLRNAKSYAKTPTGSFQTQQPKFDRLYSIDELSDDDTGSTRMS